MVEQRDFNWYPRCFFCSMCCPVVVSPRQDPTSVSMGHYASRNVAKYRAAPERNEGCAVQFARDGFLSRRGEAPDSGGLKKVARVSRFTYCELHRERSAPIGGPRLRRPKSGTDRRGFPVSPSRCCVPVERRMGGSFPG